jgi:lysophospholipase L1-like esterase
MTASTRDRVRRGVGVVLLACGGVALVLAGAELVARMVWEPTPPSTHFVAEELRALPDLRTKAELMQPNLHARNAGALYESNSAGFRGRERSEAKPPGGYRIALIGDSLAMGWGVAEADSYAARLEAALARRSGAPVEVLNFAIAGFDAVEAVDRFEQLALRYQPDLVLYGFTLNDIDNAHYRRSAPALGQVHDLLMAHPSVLWRILLPRIGAIREVLFAPYGTPLYELDDNWFHNPPAWDAMLAALDRLSANARARRLCAVLLIHPQLHYLNALHPYHRHYDAIAAAAEARGFFVVRPIGDFLGRKDRALWAAYDDPHPGPEAHALLAARLLHDLRGLPPRCRVPAERPARG